MTAADGWGVVKCKDWKPAAAGHRRGTTAGEHTARSVAATKEKNDAT